MEPIAILSIGCRFPGGNDPERFWHLLHHGVDAITEVPPDRWDVDAFYDPEPATPEKMNTRWGGFLEQVDQFEPWFFGISGREAELMDPQQRLLLEVTWEALENAGLAADELSGSRTGVFIGISNSDYARLLYGDLSDITAYSATGTCLSVAANRISYLLNFRGPSVALDTACSSSLVSVHLACQSLRGGESDLCVAGGVNLILSPEGTITFSQARMMAPDGRCKTFDARADGYVRGEGCGMVVLKRLSDALRDGDHVLAVIRGSAVNQDGLTNGLTAPNGPSQQAVIRQALQNAGVEPARISLVETHGTGTSLGDPIEVRSLKRAHAGAVARPALLARLGEDERGPFGVGRRDCQPAEGRARVAASGDTTESAFHATQSPDLLGRHSLRHSHGADTLVRRPPAPAGRDQCVRIRRHQLPYHPGGSPRAHGGGREGRTPGAPPHRAGQE